MASIFLMSSGYIVSAPPVSAHRRSELVPVETYYTKPNGQKNKLEAVTIHTMIKVLKMILGRKVWRDSI